MTRKNIYLAPETELLTVRFDRNFMESRFHRDENTETFIQDDEEELES